MKIMNFSHAAPFLDAALPLLMQDEALNNVMIGLAMELRQQHSDAYFALLSDHRPALAAFMTPAGPLHLYGKDCTAGHLNLLAHNIRQQLRSVSQVVGPAGLTNLFASVWSNTTGYKAVKNRLLSVYCLERDMLSPKKRSGMLRSVEGKDEQLLTQWMYEMSVEAGTPMRQEEAGYRAKQSIADGDWYAWEVEGTPVSMAGQVRSTPNGIAIHSVYTPPLLRNMGHAADCVAALSEALLRSGYEFCCIFADDTHAGAGRMYANMGYEQLEHVIEHHFQLR
ncbi:GNAT family N-acetyltransferase [Paenibacillus apiarius]|uniref:GNAT family N-acetyltransferase n=1 Tax=Paenibacillus apiarius TaxID=46240 RepID=UPI00197D4493|nr:GNAT family N-acetyltransferase [Paenibacillus apiarius]MBN3526669.1 hypothetical protein [Paenibacillus apiarius]